LVLSLAPPGSRENEKPHCQVQQRGLVKSSERVRTRLPLGTAAARPIAAVPDSISQLQTSSQAAAGQTLFRACTAFGRAETLRCGMGWKRKISGSVLALIGYMLSPLSWWNDMFVNVPLALVFAWIMSAFYKPAFTASLVVGYWLTNVVGFVLMHKGAQQIITEKDKSYSRRELLQDIGISLAYTLVIVALIKFGILKPFQNYFGSK
jgi:hypothetical protein